MKILEWVLRVVPAAILLQTLFFKFTAAPESVYIFETLGLEPWGRIGSGLAELVAAVLLLVPRPRLPLVGAALGVALMVGAIGSHLTRLGIEVQGDGGLLFGLAVAVLVCCAAVVYLRRNELAALLGR